MKFLKQVTPYHLMLIATVLFCIVGIVAFVKSGVFQELLKALVLIGGSLVLVLIPHPEPVSGNEQQKQK